MSANYLWFYLFILGVSAAVLVLALAVPHKERINGKKTKRN